MSERATEQVYDAIRKSVAWRVLPRDGILVEGADAAEWLQGQLSQDLDGLRGAARSAETLVLSPQGRIDSYCRVTMLGGEPAAYLLDTKPGTGANLYERLRRFKLRVKATLGTLDGLHVLEQRGPLAVRIEGPNEDARAALIAAQLRGLGEAASCWPGFEGADWLFTGDPSKVPALAAAVGLGPQDSDVNGRDEAFEAARIEAGVPQIGRELTERTIPQEAGQLVAMTVSFTKGCYTGQELVARIDARGSNTPRRLRGVVVPGRPPSGRPGLGGSAIRQGDSVVGEVTSAAWSPGLGATVALAYLKRGVEVPAAVTVDIGRPSHDNDHVAIPGEVRDLPLSGPPAARGLG